MPVYRLARLYHNGASARRSLIDAPFVSLSESELTRTHMRQLELVAIADPANDVPVYMCTAAV